MVIDEIKTSVGSAVSSISGKLKDSLSFLSDIKDAGWDKVNVVVNDVLGLAPLIEVTGFNMKEISVEAGIPPGILLYFLKEKDVDAETIDKMLEEHKDKEMLALIVRALEKADTLQKAMKLSDYKFAGLNLKLGLPPVALLRLVRQDPPTSG